MHDLKWKKIQQHKSLPHEKKIIFISQVSESNRKLQITLKSFINIFVRLFIAHRERIQLILFYFSIVFKINLKERERETEKNDILIRLITFGTLRCVP